MFSGRLKKKIGEQGHFQAITQRWVLLCMALLQLISIIVWPLGASGKKAQCHPLKGGMKPVSCKGETRGPGNSHDQTAGKKRDVKREMGCTTQVLKRIQGPFLKESADGMGRVRLAWVGLAFIIDYSNTGGHTHK